MVKQFLSVVFCLLLMGGSALAAGNGIELNFNDESAQARLGMIINQDDYGTSMLDFRGLYNDEDDLSQWLGSVAFHFLGTPGGVPGLDLGVIVDVKTGESDVSDTEFGALGIGGLVNYFPPVLRGFGASGRAIYSPQIFSFLEAEKVSEFSIRAGYKITPKIGVHVEYQKVEVEFDRWGDSDIDDELRIGFEARF